MIKPIFYFYFDDLIVVREGVLIKWTIQKILSFVDVIWHENWVTNCAIALRRLLRRNSRKKRDETIGDSIKARMMMRSARPRTGRRLFKLPSRNLILLALAIFAILPPIFFHFRLRRFHQVPFSSHSLYDNLNL